MRLRKAEARPELACPHPEKTPFKTEVEAYHCVLKRSKVTGRAFRVYECYTADGKKHFHMTKKLNRVDRSPALAA
jgi:hypothetical protein